MAEGIDIPAQLADRLRFRDPTGRLVTWTIRYGPGPTVLESGVLSRSVTSDDGIVAVRKWVPAEMVSGSPAACEALENEARAGMRLAARFPERYPSEVTRLLGYDLDGAEPFVLLALPRGRPAADAGHLLLDQRHAFQVGLLRALVVIDAAGVVHGNLTATTVRWDGYTVQLTDFTHAMAIGDARRARPDLDGAPPELRTGTGVVSPADDVWSAGAVIVRVVTGRAGDHDLAQRGAALRNLLDGVFASSADERPSAKELLGRLGADAAVPPPDPVATRRLDEGEREFDKVLATKWPSAPEPVFPDPVAPAVMSTRAQITAVVVVLVFVLILVLIIWG